jgi:hypothetical protein
MPQTLSVAPPHFIPLPQPFQSINILFVMDADGKLPASLQIPCEVKVA